MHNEELQAKAEKQNKIAESIQQPLPATKTTSTGLGGFRNWGAEHKASTNSEIHAGMFNLRISLRTRALSFPTWQLLT